MKKTLTTTAVLTSLLFSSFAFSPTASAENYDEKIHSLEQQKSGIEEKENATASESSRLQTKITASEEKVEELKSNLKTAQKEMKQLQTEIEALEDLIVKRNERLADQARSIQTKGHATNYISFIIEAESLSDVFGRIDVVGNLVNANQSLVAEQISDKQAVADKKIATEESIEKQNNRIAALEGTQTHLHAQKLEKEVVVAQLAIEHASVEGERQQYIAQREAAEQAATEFAAIQEAEAQAVAVAVAQSAPEAAVESESVTTSEPTVSEVVTHGRPAPVDHQSSPSTSSASNHSNSQTNPTRSINSSSTKTPTQMRADEPKSAPQSETPKSSISPLSVGGNYMGTPYAWGGTSPGGFDCSGFVQYAFAQTGRSLPRTTGAQYAATTPVSSPQAGDLVFFSGDGSSITHVGIYSGGGQYLGAQTSTGVAYASSTSGYWGARLVGYGRL